MMRIEVIGGSRGWLIDQPLANAMSTAMFVQLPGLIAEAEGKKHVLTLLTSVRVINSAPERHRRIVSTPTMPIGAPPTRMRTPRTARWFAPTVWTVAFVDGDCVGGGCGLALACDIRCHGARASARPPSFARLSAP
jgi:enoyl-CoA hydratase/carnithine racemase